ncbi:MAG: hypothetical protein EPO26_18240 [Chloroflexota bacterium]|nr:MAG: hypothetical protein EPO26_18240 [Chloroflexota bacterium]
MAIDLNFAGQRTAYGTHGVHSFAAKFPPQLARWGIESFSEAGETVLDPMVGSGTTLVEARLLGRHGLGVDIDPLARLIAAVKSTPLPTDVLAAATRHLLVDAGADFADLRLAREYGIPFRDAFRDIPIPEFPNRDYWFMPKVSEELALLRRRLDRIDPKPIRDFFYVVFSSTIITKSSSSVANVRDLAHSRPHFATPRVQPDVLRAFVTRLARMTRAMNDLTEGCASPSSARIIGDDARRLALADRSVDLIFTSPPYVNAIDYPRAHKFSLFWLGDALGTSTDAYRDLGRSYIGTDRVPIKTCHALTRERFGIASLDATIERLAEADPRRAGVASRYFDDMGRALSEMGRVLRPGRQAVIVVCPSRIADVNVATHDLLAELAEARTSGVLRHVETHERTLDDSRRQLPITRGRFGPGMRTEFVVVLRRDAASL